MSTNVRPCQKSRGNEYPLERMSVHRTSHDKMPVTIYNVKQYKILLGLLIEYNIIVILLGLLNIHRKDFASHFYSYTILKVKKRPTNHINM